MHGIIRFSLQQVVLYNLIFVLLMVAGSFALVDVPVERYPDVQFGEVLIHTVYPGASPHDVEALVTQKIEDALEGVPDIEFVRSTSYHERSVVHLKFRDDTPYEKLYDDVRFHILSRLGELPEGVDPPQIDHISINDVMPVVVVNLTGARGNRALALMADEIKLKLSRLEGVKEVQVRGEYEQEFHVILAPDKMRALGVTFDQVAAALHAANLSVPAGDFNDGTGEFIVRVDEKFHSREQVLQTIVRKDGDGMFTRVADVARDAFLGYRDPTVISSVNGEDAVSLWVIKNDVGNAIRIVAGVRAVLAQFEPMLAKERAKAVLTQDSSVYVQEDIQVLGSNLLTGIILVSLIIWYFMGIRNAGLIVIGIPFAFMAAILIMHATGNSLNQISLFAFVLMSGVVVDDATVVVENIFRHIEEGQEVIAAIVDGTAEVMLPVISAMATTVAAFLPMLLMTGSTGEFFAQIPTTVTYVLVASLFECLFILPIHYLDYGPRLAVDARAPLPSPSEAQPAHDVHCPSRAGRIMQRLVLVALRFRWASLLLLFLAFGAAMTILLASITGLAPLIKIKFFPDDYTTYFVSIDGPGHASRADLDAKAREITRAILAQGTGMAQSAVGFGGFQQNEEYEEVLASNLGMIIVTLPRKQDQHFADYPRNDPAAHLDAMRTWLKTTYEKDGYTLRVNAQKDGPPTGKAITLRVLGNDDALRNQAADAIWQFMRTDPEIAPHLVDATDSRGSPKRVLRLHVDHAKAAEFNLQPAQVAVLAGSVLDGRYTGKYRAIDEEIDLKLHIDPATLHGDPAALLDLPLVEHASGPVRLGDVCTIENYKEAADIRHYQGERSVSLEANLAEDAPTSTPVVVQRIESFYKTIQNRYPGILINFGGEHEDTQRSYRSLAYAFTVAILLMYLILATQFQSYVQPLIILSSVVFALIGVIFGTFFTQTLFTVNSFIAIVGLAGVVVNNSIILVDFINTHYAQGMARRDAILAGVRVRLRPILLTTATTILGLLPMALGFPSYSLVWGTMASTFVTGLATSTLLSLLFVPVLWDMLAARHKAAPDEKTLESMLEPPLRLA